MAQTPLKEHIPHIIFKRRKTGKGHGSGHERGDAGMKLLLLFQERELLNDITLRHDTDDVALVIEDEDAADILIAHRGHDVCHGPLGFHEHEMAFD
jgi:hypothetical protein